MKKLLIIAIALISLQATAQQDAWVYFTNKPNAQFYLDNPLQMLSQRSIDRRVTQNIPIDLVDVPIHEPYVTQIDAVANITVMATSKWLNAVHVRGTVLAINMLSQLSFVNSIDFADSSLNDSNRPTQSNAINRNAETQVDYPYGNSANQIEMLNGHLLHQQNYTGSGKIIAVMDAGFPGVDVAQPFQRLWDNNLILGGYNFVDRNDNIFTRNNHGTLVLSTMGGYKANQLVGTAPDAAYYLFITEDVDSENPIEESNWVEAAEMADSLGVDVINTSLGYFDYDNPAYSYTYQDLDGVTSFATRGADIAFSRGMVVVVSAGNSGASGDPYIGVPGDAFNALTVGAVNAAGNYVSFSSIGPTADGRVKPDVAAKGQAAVVSNTNGTITTANGTSFAGPIMAGMVASFWQAVPSKTNAEIIQLIKQSAHLYANPTAQLGYGIPNFSSALSAALVVAEFSEKHVVVYPNPFGQHFSISLPEGISRAQVSVFDALGQFVLQQETGSNATISTDQLASGLYFYRINAGDLSFNGKIIKL